MSAHTPDAIREAFFDNPPDDLVHLMGHVHRLPRINDDGSSECPFAEQWYFGLAEAIMLTENRYNQLCDVHAGLPGHIADLRSKLRSLSDDDYPHGESALAQNAIAVREQDIAWGDIVLPYYRKALRLARESLHRFPREPRGSFGARPGQVQPRIDHSIGRAELVEKHLRV